MFVERPTVVHCNTTNLWWSVLIWIDLLRIWNQRFLQQPFSYCETCQCCPWQPKLKFIGTDLKGSASNLKPTLSSTTFSLLWNVSVLSMKAKTKYHRCWFEEVCFGCETSGFCSDSFLMVKHLNAVHDRQNPEWSVLFWRGLLRIWNQRILQQPFSYGETRQCCPWRTDLKSSASNQKPTFSATTMFWLWNVSVLSMTAKAWDHLYCFEEVCLEFETKSFCANHFGIVKRLSIVHESQSLGAPALIWRGLLLIWNQQYLQQPSSYGGASRCFPWQPKLRIIGTALKKSASTVKTYGFCNNHVLIVKRLSGFHDSWSLC